MSSASDWEEIKRLAADFQKAQLSSTVQRLSERNCVEIVTKLIELRLLDVIFTTDGKEYLTPQQLVKEIKDELYVSGGRINIVDLAKELNVDLNQINISLPEVTKRKEAQLISGYLIAHDYLEKIAREINEKLQLQGQISVNELTLLYDLPAEFLQHNILEHYLDKIVFGKQDTSDPRIFYTNEYIVKTKSKIKGALMGLLKPTPVTVIINQCNMNDRLFMTLFDKLDAPGVLTGRQAGALYVPSCYTKSQNEWVQNFYKQNNYLEYDALTRLGLNDPKSFIKRIFPKEDLVFLSSCAIGSQIKQQLETALEECISSKSYLDVVNLLPSIFSDADVESIIETLLKNNKNSTVLFDNTVFSIHFIENLKQLCMPIVEKKAQSFVKSGKYQQYYVEQHLSSRGADVQSAHFDQKAERREERRRKAATGKGGGGTQGRETKTKAIKKHSRTKQVANDSDSDDYANVEKKQSQPDIVTVADTENVIKELLENEGLEELLSQVAEFLHGQLNQAALAIAKEQAEKLLQDASQNRKQTHSSIQDKINILVNDIKLYEKGLKTFPADQQPQFVKYLFKSIGSDVLTEFCKYAASQSNLPFSETPTIENRNKLINDLSEDYKKSFKALNVALNEQNWDSFYQAIDECLLSCEMILKKVDKKKDKSLIQNHREKLLMELENCDDPPLALHLAVLAIFTTLTQNMLHASGRLIPVIIAFLKGQMNEEEYKSLQCYHEQVTKYLISDNEIKPTLEDDLRSKMLLLKKIVQDAKKFK